MGSSGPLFELHFDMVQRRVRHEHGAAQFQQHRRLDHLHVSPQVADAVAAIAEPPAARPLLQRHLHRFALRRLVKPSPNRCSTLRKTSPMSALMSMLCVVSSVKSSIVMSTFSPYT